MLSPSFQPVWKKLHICSFETINSSTFQLFYSLNMNMYSILVLYYAMSFINISKYKLAHKAHIECVYMIYLDTKIHFIMCMDAKQWTYIFLFCYQLYTTKPSEWNFMFWLQIVYFIPFRKLHSKLFSRFMPLNVINGIRGQKIKRNNP